MKRITASVLAAILFLMPIAQSQHEAPLQMTPRANQGHVPPPPARNSSLSGERLGNGKINDSQHVNHDRWYGHDSPGDPRFHLDHPFDHGYFDHGGREQRYNIFGVDWIHHRFELPGAYHFEVAAWDWPVFSDWCLNCGYDFVVYADPDHPGWYLLYNIHIGIYVHVRYLGK